MIRKIIVFVLVLTIVSLSIIGYVYYKQRKYNGVDYWRLIPENTLMVVKTHSFHHFFSKLSTNNVIWQELKNTPFFDELNTEGEWIDSLLVTSSFFSETIKHNDVVASIHTTSQNKWQILLILPFNKNVSGSRVMSEIEKISITKQNKMFEGFEIFEIKRKNKEKSYFTIIENVGIASASISLVEESIRQFKSGKIITQNTELQTIIETSGNSADASVFIKVDDFIKTLGHYLNEEKREYVLELSDFMGWVNIDASIKPNTLLLNGFAHSSDSAKHFLSLFSSQKPSEIEAISVMPENTAWFWHMSFSNFITWKTNLQKFKHRKYKSAFFNSKIEEWNKMFECDVEEELLGWINKEIVIGALNQKPDSAAGNVFILFRTTEERDAVKRLRHLASSAEGWYTEQYLEYEIQRLPIDSPFYYLLGKPYASISKPYFAFVSEYVVMANTIEVVKSIIHAYHSSRTLNTNTDYRQFAENIASESNLFFYCAVPHSFPSIINILNDELKNRFLENAETIKKFQAFSWQISYTKKNLYYNSIYVKYNPTNKEKKSGLWNVEIDAELTYGPYFFSNHTTNAKDIVVQDEQNHLYLISNTGKIFWKKQLDGPIKGNITEVDMLNNGKLQMLLNTNTSVYIIDRKGNFYNGFPIKLPALATSSVAALDYEKNKTYRFIIACNDNKIYNYDMAGKPVDGWQSPVTENIVLFPVFHFATQGKDYVVVAENNGKVYALDRKGQLRLSFKNKIAKSGLLFFKVEPSISFENSRIVALDSSGLFFSLSFTDRLDTFQLFSGSTEASFAYRDLNKDKINELIFFKQGELKVVSEKNEEMIRQIFPGQAPGKVDVFYFNKNNIIGVLYEATEELYMYHSKGELLQGFPISIKETYIAGDMNNDGILNIITVSGKTVRAMNVE